MTDVSEWAKREAKREWPEEDWEGHTRGAYAEGIMHLAALLLSDEAVEAAAGALWGTNEEAREDARNALRAALDKITSVVSSRSIR